MLEESKGTLQSSSKLNGDLSASRNQDSDLRSIVEELRSELSDVRSDFKKMNYENERLQGFIN